MYNDKLFRVNSRIILKNKKNIIHKPLLNRRMHSIIKAPKIAPINSLSFIDLHS